MAKAIKGAEELSVGVFLVVGSHGLRSSDAGFIVVEDLRTKGQRILPTPQLAINIKVVWPRVPLFIDSCYSTHGCADIDYDGHETDPKYREANFKVAQWAEIAALERSAGVLGLPM
jgi:hypothetical protein